MRNTKAIIALLVVLLIGLGLGVFLWQGQDRLERIVIDADRTIEGDFAVDSTQRLVLANGAKLTVTGNFDVDGELVCEHGAVQASVGGELHVRNKISCPDPSLETGIAIVAKTFTFDASSSVVSAGSVQLVDQPSKVLVAEQLNRVYDDVEKNTGSGQRVGPMIEGNGSQSNRTQSRPVAMQWPNLIPIAHAVFGVATAEAQAAPAVTLRGNWQIIGEGELPPAELAVERRSPKVKRVLLNFDFGSNGDVQIQDFTLSGPHGSHGENVYDTCSALGGRGGDAMRLNVMAKNISINNFKLTLGDGGDGGIAKTSKDCEKAFATGGDGGKPGNFKMTASGTFQIAGSFEVTPGRGGMGGLAEATSKTGDAACPGKKGGDADARGGKGGDNLNVLASAGSVGGSSNVSVGDVIGGRGGDAIANAGNGGAGNACGCVGGMGGKATAVAGHGGKAVKSGAGWAFAISEGGDGGDASANAGHGGSGGSCGPDKKGGNGGVGGNSSSKAGKAGIGGDQAGTDGEVLADKGGNGGNGGDGCMPGRGGLGGNPSGTPGQLGKITCIIEVIKPKDKYLLTDGLHVAGADACAEEHWHGTATATDGSTIPDPNPGACGHCTVSQCPVIKGDVASPIVPTSAIEDLRDMLQKAEENIQSLRDFFRALSQPAVTTPSARVEIRGGIFGN